MTEQPQPAPTPEERPLWKLDRSEQRILAITFVGGVASIVVAAVIIGTAIALARHVNGSSVAATLNSMGTSSFLITVGICIFVLAGALLVNPATQKVSGKPFARVRRIASFVAWACSGILTLSGIVAGLAFIGMAAGIH
jgi:hypothetical protein